jgi:hypothetical protein
MLRTENLVSNFRNPATVRNRWRCSHIYAIVTLVSFCLPSGAIAQNSAGQELFSSPETAVTKLVGAAKNDDMNELTSILGSDAKEILYSGDPVEDNTARDNFVAKYNEMHRLAYNDQDRVILYLGSDNWPFPIPLEKKQGGWVFDTEAGKTELLYRRIGRNELYTINVLQYLVAGQREYAREARADGGVWQYARKIQSDPGKRNGLYWPTAEGQPESPIGPLIADATAQGYKTGTGTPVAFHGYYYKVLTRQGKNAPGGPKNYIVHGKMIKGFAFLAYPAVYRASGVMTFMVNRNGIIVQKDLGPDTAKLANDITDFNPDKTWDQDIINPGEEFEEDAFH